MCATIYKLIFLPRNQNVRIFDHCRIKASLCTAVCSEPYDSELPCCVSQPACNFATVFPWSYWIPNWRQMCLNVELADENTSNDMFLAFAMVRLFKTSHHSPITVLTARFPWPLDTKNTTSRYLDSIQYLHPCFCQWCWLPKFENGRWYTYMLNKIFGYLQQTIKMHVFVLHFC